MKMGELVDTEERYVLKLNELVRHVADDFRQSAKQRSSGSISPTEEEVDRLFPKSVDRILQMNTAFMEELRHVMDSTEEEAMRDMELPFPAPRLGGSVSTRAKDPSGALAMARIFLEWFPRFTDCYQDYIRASNNFPQLLNSFLEKQSSFRQRVVQTGEQTIRSLLIEPVQRLPRYSLFIDQIVTCLPITHPALQLLLRARDIITNICSMDDPLPDKPHITNRLRTMVECWPLDLEPQGRLIFASDFVELAAPYVSGPRTPELQERAGIMLIFSDCVVILQKKANFGPTARDFLREIDKPSAAGLLASMTNGTHNSWDFAFTGWHTLADVRFTESSDGRLIWMTSTQEMKGAHSGEFFTSKAITSRCFMLQESYHGRASRWSEDIIKARIEGRFSEAEREDSAWTLRAVKMTDSNFGLHAAVFQEGADQLIEGRKEPAPIRIVLDNDKGTKGAPVGHYGVEIVIEIRTGDMKRITMNTLGLNGKRYTDDIALEDLIPTVSRRIIQLLSHQFSVSNMKLVPALVSYYTKVLRAIHITSKVEKNPKSFLGTSPVKMLSNFLAGTSNASSTATSADSTITSPPKLQRTPLGNVATLFPSQAPRGSQKDLTLISGSLRDRDGIRIGGDDERPENPLVRLEQTFTGYVANLQARKGYFIGRTLLNRSMADELSVNDLYNRLIEFPFDLDASADVGTEVIFAAFEKFIRIAWRDQIGHVMSMQSLDALQVRASKRVPGDFADFVHYLFGDMAPQNRRAFTALIKLLADLLDGCGNDGDRGALTLAFAELLVDDGNAPNYINLLDRLVEDCDRIFDDGGFANNTLKSSAYESLNASSRSHKSTSGSMTSNTSSLRRKFGFDTLLRQNSKVESERPSMWRSLSKHHSRQAASDSSPSFKSSVNRSRSVDMGIPGVSGPNKLRRPGSRDRPPIAGAFDDIQHRPTSSHRLETIGEPEIETAEAKSLKKKRRSSLSDLKSLMAAASLEDPPLMPLRINKQQTGEKFNSSPRAPSPSKIPISPHSPAQLLRSSRQKENVQDPSQQTAVSTAATPENERVVQRPHAKTLSTSQIPTLRPTRLPTNPIESPSRPSTSPSKTTAATTSQKLRLQSPQKLRERLQVEKKAVDEVDASLKSELSRIAEDMARVNSALPRSATTDLRKLSAAVKALEERVPQEMAELQERQDAVQRDMEATLKATEAKVKAIDQLYKEANAENELLYEKFNSELGKIVKALKGKGREDKEELMGRLKESSEEAARVKKENARLRREMVSLRTLLKGGGD
ncbi:hypothetical protein B0H67DRAFT_580874 [Lasiosphaeris hirsuta]|uniref:DH domain-containing protein n=1 Tax=Lasiosphaeris hirsuta TaxID=260670 RepID=A0AA40DVX9_9PEZI|nr:hypothetical protein B0H67DRAFT_580874 [Lasiosphaeris hirsuta]